MNLTLLLSKFSYNPSTGQFLFFNAGSGRKLSGVRKVRIDGKDHSLRNLAWFFVHGEYPVPHRDIIQHINGDVLDYRILNLRKISLFNPGIKIGEKLTQDLVKATLHYDPENGVLTRIVNTSLTAMAGSNPVSFDKAGYAALSLYGSRLAHRVAWIYFYGEDPAQDIDHINGDKADFRIANLRLVTPGQNALNMGPYKSSKTGFKGVFKIGLKRKDGSEIWVAESQVNGKKKYIGRYYTMDEAVNAYVEFAFANHGEFIHESLFPYLNSNQLEIVMNRRQSRNCSSSNHQGDHYAKTH